MKLSILPVNFRNPNTAKKHIAKNKSLIKSLCTKQSIKLCTVCAIAGPLQPTQNVAIPWKQLSVLEVVVVLFRVLVVVHGVRQRCATHFAGAEQSALLLHRCNTCEDSGSLGRGGSVSISIASVVDSIIIVVVMVVTVTGCASDVDVWESSGGALDDGSLSAALVVAAVGVVNVRSVGYSPISRVVSMRVVGRRLLLRSRVDGGKVVARMDGPV